MWLILLAAFAGAVAHGLMAWADSHEPFNGKLFLKTFVTGVVAAVAFAAGYTLTQTIPEIKDYLLAFLGGFSGNAARDYLKGAIR